MVMDDERELRAGAIALYEEVPLINTMVSVVAQAFAFGGATLHTFNSGAAQVPQASSLLDESLLKKVVVGWSVYGHAQVPLSVRADGAVAATEDQDAAEPVVLQTREPRGPGTDGLPLLWTISINAQTVLDHSLWIATPEIVEPLINFMGLEPWMVRPDQLAIANVDALSVVLSFFETQVEDLRRQFKFELLRECEELIARQSVSVGVDLEWGQDISVKDSALGHGPTVKVFASCGIPLTGYARTKLEHARRLADSGLMPRSVAAEAERWFS